MPRSILANVALLAPISFVLGCAAGPEGTSDAWRVENDTLAGGIPLVVNIPPPAGVQVGFRLTEELRIGTMDGDGPDSFGDVRAIAVAADGRIVALGNSSGYTSVPFFSRAQQFIHPDGTVWVSDWGRPVHTLARTTLAGDTLMVVETRRTPLAIPAPVRDSAISAIQDRLRTMNATILNQSWDKVPTNYALVEAVLSDDQGRLWVETGSESGTVWDVFSTEGVYSHSVGTDLRLVSWQQPVVKGDYLYGVVTDEFQVSYVVRARIELMGGSA